MTDLWQGGRHFAPRAPPAAPVPPPAMGQASSAVPADPHCVLLRGDINGSGCGIPNGHDPPDRPGRDASS